MNKTYPEDMVLKTYLHYIEKEFKLDKNYTGFEQKAFSSQNRTYELREVKNFLENILPKNLKTDIIADDFTVKSVLTLHI